MAREIFEPFNFHWNEGEPPPLVMDELNVTAVPEQIVVVAVLMLIVGTELDVTVINIPLDIAFAEVAHAILEVSAQVITSLFANVELE